MKPAGFRSVVEAHAPAEVEADDPQTRLWRKLNFFPTPCWAARAGAELVRDIDPVARWFCDPACGEGHLVGPVGEMIGPTRHMSAFDVHDYGRGFMVRDWFDDAAWAGHGVPLDWIITNPPFSLAESFVHLGLRRVSRGVALLLRNSFIETSGRHALFTGAQPLTVLAPFCERVSMELGRWRPGANHATAYSWFIWVKGQPPRPPRWIPPGTKARLTRPADVERYGWREPTPLLPAGAA